MHGPCATHVRTSDVTYEPGVVELSTGHCRTRVDDPVEPTGHSATIDPATMHALHDDHESAEQSIPPMLTDGVADTLATELTKVSLSTGDSRSLATSIALLMECVHPASCAARAYGTVTDHDTNIRLVVCRRTRRDGGAGMSLAR